MNIYYPDAGGESSPRSLIRRMAGGVRCTAAPSHSPLRTISGRSICRAALPGACAPLFFVHREFPHEWPGGIDHRDAAVRRHVGRSAGGEASSPAGRGAMGCGYHTEETYALVG